MNDPEHNQVGGSHYKDLPIQPARYIAMNGIGFLAGCVIKRMTRYNRPTGKGLQDLEKAKHEIELLIKFEKERQEGAHFESDDTEEAPAIILPDGRPAYKFDLQRALAGEPIVTREGEEMSDFRKRENYGSLSDYPYMASDTMGRYFGYTKYGGYLLEVTGSFDLFMLYPAKPSAIIWRTHTPGDPCPVEDGETEISWRYPDGPAWHLTGRCKANDAPWNQLTEYRII